MAVRLLVLIVLLFTVSPYGMHRCRVQQGEVQPGEQLLQKALDVWKGPSMIVTGDNDPTIPTQVRTEQRPFSCIERSTCWRAVMDEIGAGCIAIGTHQLLPSS